MDPVRSQCGQAEERLQGSVQDVGAYSVERMAAQYQDPILLRLLDEPAIVSDFVIHDARV